MGKSFLISPFLISLAAGALALVPLQAPSSVHASGLTSAPCHLNRATSVDWCSSNEAGPSGYGSTAGTASVYGKAPRGAMPPSPKHDSYLLAYDVFNIKPVSYGLALLWYLFIPY